MHHVATRSQSWLIALVCCEQVMDEIRRFFRHNNTRMLRSGVPLREPRVRTLGAEDSSV